MEDKLTKFDFNWMHKLEEVRNSVMEKGLATGSNEYYWIRLQKEKYERCELPQWKVELLGLSCLFEVFGIGRDNEWVEILHEIKKKKESGIEIMPGSKEYGWMAWQKNAYNTLPGWKREKLSEIGILNMTGGDRSWDEGIKHAKEYKEKYGDLIVRESFVCEDGFELGQWIRTQRSIKAGKSKGNLSKEREEQLNAIGMVWRQRIAPGWDAWYDMAVKYYLKNGNVNVKGNYLTEDGYKLGHWLLNQRTAKNNQKRPISEEKIRKLDALRIVWKKEENEEIKGKRTNPENLVGTSYHGFIVKDIKRENGRNYLYVNCPQCHEDKWMRKDTLDNAKVISCGCWNAKKNYKKPVDISGMWFDRLRAIEPTGKKDSENGSYLWLCECKCGNKKIVSEGDLVSGTVKSCGCLGKENSIKNGKRAGETIKEKYCIEGTNVNNLTAKTPKNNKSGIKGVSWDSRNEKWIAQIGFKGKNFYLGRFDTKEQAAEARKEAEDNLHGEFLEWYREEISKKDRKDM